MSDAGDDSSFVLRPSSIQLTYGELDRRTNQLAQHLRALGVGPEDRVGVRLAHSPELIVALLGTLKAGSAYVPLDPDYPADRVAFMLEDAQVAALITANDERPPTNDEGSAFVLRPSSFVHIVHLERDWPAIARRPAHAPAAPAAPANLAYVIYTSGSTGSPKGVLVTHANATRLFAATDGWFQFGESDVWTLFHSYAFDFSVWEFLGALLHGGRLIVPPYLVSRSPEAFYALLRDERVTVLNQTPSAFQQLIWAEETSGAAGPLDLRLIIFGGEALDVQSLRPWFARHGDRSPQLVNMYGITETTVHVTYRPLSAADLDGAARSAIGGPIPDLRMYILDRRMQPVPPGVVGELYVGGAGLARGYLGRPDLTAERFLPNPFAGIEDRRWKMEDSDASADETLSAIFNPRSSIGYQLSAIGYRLYRTGDLARYRANADVEYVGRADQQVKIRGYRIELGEIEAALRRRPDVREAAVVAREDAPGEKRLVAYVVIGAAGGEAGGEQGEALDQQIAEWRQVFDTTYAQSERRFEPDFNIAGWNSSESGAPLPDAAMREWVEQTVARIRALRPRRVLEIGCGTGLLLLRIAPECERYVGTDISAAALDLLRPQIADLPQTTLLQRSADDFAALDAGSFDLVILNSVVQYFPGIDYLVRVLEGAAHVVAGGGAIFVGDVRSLPLMEAFHAGVELRRAPEALPLAQLRQRVRRRADQENELAIDPAFFAALMRHLPQIGHADVQLKRGREQNELTQFRYDALLHIGAPPLAALDWRDWRRERTTLEELRRELCERAPERLGVAGVPNARVQASLRAAERMADPGAATVGDLRRALAHPPEDPGIEPEDLWALGERMGYAVEIRWPGAGPGRYDALFRRRAPDGTAAPSAPAAPAPAQPWSAYANNPLADKLARNLAPALRGYLKERLPEYMLPAAFVAMDALPLTPSGKLDRRALPPPDTARPELDDAFVAPRTPAEQILAEVWSQILRVEQVGVHDNFFALGGDSIRSIQALSAARDHGLALTLPQLFQHQTIAELARVIEPASAATPAAHAAPFGLIDPRDRALLAEGVEDAYPPAMLQAGMLFHSEYDADAAVYHDIFGFHLRAPLDLGRMQAAADRLLKRHAILRTSFEMIRFSEPLQLVYRVARAPLRVADLRALAPGEQDRALADWMEGEKRRPFDWTRAPLLRFHVHRRSAETFQLTVSFHHAILDGWSVGVMVAELFQLYFGLLGRATEPLDPPPESRFRDFVALERAAIESDEARAYWMRLLDGSARILLPRWPAAYRETGPQASFRYNVPISAELSAGIQQFARAAGVPLKSALLAAHARVISLLAGQPDVLLGLLFNGRPETADGERALGMFLNTLPLRMRLAGGTWADLAQQAFAAEREMLPFRRYPMAHLQQIQGGQPLFETMFNFVHFHVYQRVLAIEDLHELEELSFHRSNFTMDANFGLDPASARVQLALSYDPAALCREQVAAIGGYYARTLARMAERPGERYDLFSPLAPHEQRQILVAWNDTARDFPHDQPFIRLFEAQAARTPDAVALTFDDASTTFVLRSSSFVHLTYDALNRRANRMAHLLARRGAGPESAVALLDERGPDLLTAILAAFKAGSAYLPLDPRYPVQRLQIMLEQSGAQIALVGAEAAPTLAQAVERMPAEARPCVLPIAAPLQGERWETNLPARADPSQLAYLIYTSGSTGTPKGAMVEQRGMLNHLYAKIADLALTGADSIAQTASQSFDISVWQFLAALIVGGQVQIMPDEVALDPARLLAQVAAARISILEIVPSLLQALLDAPDGADLRALRWLILTGEALPPELCRRWLRRHPGIPLLNAYGPTECSDDVTHQPLACPPDADASHTPIGRPIANTQIYILDDKLQPLPIGVAGAVYVGGVGVGRGYRSRPDLTAAAFVPNPFAGINAVETQNIASLHLPPIASLSPHARLYKTGDLGRHRPDGAIEYLGRIDDQVKLRGYRIELGEIEAALRAHPAVREAVALAREDQPGDMRLVAYVVLAETTNDERRKTKDEESAIGDEPLSSFVLRPSSDNSHSSLAADLRTFLSARLPAYMIPAAFVDLDALPLTPNGKIDRKALPAPEYSHAPIGGQYAAPRTPLEALVARIWEQVLGAPQIGLHDNFFTLGGHSLLATQVMSRVRQVARAELPLRALFESPTVAGLAARIAQARRDAGGPADPPLEPVARESAPPLSFAQQRLWFLDQLIPHSPLYNIPSALQVSGALDVTALARSLRAVVARHEALRTTFAMAQGQPVQVIAPALALATPLIDLRGLPAEVRQATAVRLAVAEARRPFDLARGPLIRAALLRLDATAHLLLLTIHHIVSDGWSLDVLIRELGTLYLGFAAGRPARLPALPIQYADYTAWQRAWLQGAALDAQLAYWKGRLGAPPPVLELPTDRPRPAFQSFNGALEFVHVPPDLTAALAALNRRAGSTMFMTLLAALQTLLHRYSGQREVVVGSPIANRTRPELEDLIGFFVNTLALRGDLRGDLPFRALLDQVRETTLEAHEHQDLPFEKLVEELQPVRDPSRNPIFQVMLVLQNTPVSAVELPGLSWRMVDAYNGTAKFDLWLGLREEADGLRGALEYNTDLFDAGTIRRLRGHLLTLLAGAVAAPERPLADLPLLTEAERRQILVEWNATAAPFRRAQTLPALFAAQAARSPDSVALIFDDATHDQSSAIGDAARSSFVLRPSPVMHLTYAELDARANRLAQHLQALGIRDGMRVGICMDRSIELIVAVLGTLAAGSAYVPLDPVSPPARLAFMLRDAQTPVLLTQSHLLARLPEHQARVVCLDPGWERTLPAPDAPLSTSISPANLGYVIYTSGSTGNPKGVALSQRALVNLLDWQIAYLEQRPGMRFLQYASLSFDVSYQEILPTLCSGGAVALIPEDLRQDSRALWRLLDREQVERIYLPYVGLQQLAEAAVAEAEAGAGGAPRRLRHVTVSGEQLQITRQIVGMFQQLAGGTLHNFYGPSESHAVTACSLSGDPEAWPALAPIGRPIANTQMYVLDAQMQPTPIGVTGELYIGGVCLADGYLGRPDLTAERFVPTPFAGTNTVVETQNIASLPLPHIASLPLYSRLYKTGDLARYLADGDLEFLGRIDAQVKIRGYRIELEEVAAALRSHPAVRECVVVVWEAAPGDRRLAAYVVTGDEFGATSNEQPGVSSGSSLDAELREHVGRILPAYMTPSAIMELAALPLTINGKVDRARLPDPELRRAEQDPYEPPQTEAEVELAAIWAEVLQVDEVSRHDNFFVLGGHSLLATRLVSRIQARFGVDLPVRAIFEAPTLAGLAERLEALRWAVGQLAAATAGAPDDDEEQGEL